RIVAALEELDRNVLRTRVDPLVGPASLHCALIEGGIGLSTYAPECRLQVERRTIAGETDEQVLRDVEEAVRRAGEEAAVRIVFGRPPLTCDPSARVVHCLRAATTAVTGSAPEEAGVPYWMDAALFGAAGIPTANYGPLGHGAHEPVEWVDLDSVVTVAEVLADSAERFCRPD
ncbi:MAG: M20/M25/M40 family metallo-hydrolase, partial [Chloroflexi bacterium]|nr:M20/M25/M40 family metallo-hydrolase [Chloroflexota bacterium]